jgi:broad specificity phosphatase PhoE
MLYFARHGESQANVDQAFSGIHRPAPLTELGRRQAREAGRRIIDRAIHIDQMISSPLDRAYETAEIIASTLGLDPAGILLDSRLIEYDVGELAGRSTKGISAAQLIGAPGAEDPDRFQVRVKEALDAAACLGGNILIVSHAGVGQMIEAVRQGIDPASFYSLERYPNAQVVELSHIADSRDAQQLI